MALYEILNAIQRDAGQGLAAFAGKGVRRIVDGKPSPDAEEYVGFFCTKEAVVNATALTGDSLTEITIPAGSYFGGIFSAISLKAADTGVVWGVIFNPSTSTPALSTATVENAAADDIVLTYSESLDETSVPATTDFAASGGKTVTAVDVSGSVVTVTVDVAYVNADVITITYTPGTNKIQNPAGTPAVALVAEAVTNNVEP